MGKSLAKAATQPHISTKLHRHLKKQGRTDVTLKDMQRSLSGIGISLSKRVIEEREKRQLMPYFVDTSALFKRYQPEKGTTIVSQILEASDEPIFISSITIVEIVSNLKRLCVIDKITTEEQFLKQRSFFYQDIDTLGITILDMTAEDIIKILTFISLLKILSNGLCTLINSPVLQCFRI